MDNLNQIRVSMIEPDPEQPRKDFNKQELEELAASVKQYGVLQPILVKEKERGFYSIIAGERRWRAAKLAGLQSIPAIIVNETKRKAQEISLIENIQRSNLNPVDEAEGYKKLIDSYRLTQDDIAEKVSKSRTYIANSLRLLSLPPSVLSLLKEGKLTAGHARALLSLPENDQINFSQRIIKENLTVRDIERLGKRRKRQRKEREGEEYYREIEKEITEKMGRKAKIEGGDGGGEIKLQFYSLDDLEDLIEMLMKKI